MSDNLKPCPFCGASVYIEKKPLWHGSHGYYGCYEYNIYCHNCGCRVDIFGNDTIYRTDEEAEANAIKAWNRRANKNEKKGGDNP